MSGPKPAISLETCPRPLGLAVSGGSDSMALLVIASKLIAAGDLRAVTVDHGLRPEAAREAEQVAKACEALGIAHDTLCLNLPGGSGVQARGRTARYSALAGWAVQNNLAAVALGHTKDDVAETFVMRLARGSGVDGLAAMPCDFESSGARFVRPLLGEIREDLRNILGSDGVEWIDDPSNDNTDFDRVAVRQALPDLARIGVTQERLSETADWMSAAREVLERAAEDWITAYATADHGDAVFDLQALCEAPVETRYRVLSRALCAVSGNAYRPRFSALQQVLDAPATTLHGCLIYMHKSTLRITRELRAIGDKPDRRWIIDGPMQTGFEQRPLGEDGLKQVAGWRDTALVPRRSLLSSPAVWYAEDVIAAPLAAPSEQWRVTPPNPLHLAK